MKETPNIITVKDLLYLEDMMTWNYIMIKRIDELLDTIETKEVVTLLNKTRKMHLKHFKELLGILE